MPSHAPKGAWVIDMTHKSIGIKHNFSQSSISKLLRGETIFGQVVNNEIAF